MNVVFGIGVIRTGQLLQIVSAAAKVDRTHPSLEERIVDDADPAEAG
jgi:hypothetical protein